MSIPIIKDFFARDAGLRYADVPDFCGIFAFYAKKTQLQPSTSVDINMRSTESFRKVTNTKKDARLTIRIPRELKAKIDAIDRVFGVGLPKIANECLSAFCDYVELMKQTPTFPLSIGPNLPGEHAHNHTSVGKGRGIHNGHR